MAVQLGSTKFDGLLGPGPRLPEARVAVYTRPGTTNVGARVQAVAGTECEIRLVRHVAGSARISTPATYRSLKGTVVAYIDGSTNYATAYAVNYLVLDVEIEQMSEAQRVFGIDPDGNPLDQAPGAKIVSRWRLIAVPSS